MKSRWRNPFRGSPIGLVGVGILLLLALLAIVGPYTGLPSPTQTALAARMQPPTIGLTGLGAHPFGTDQLGRDLLSRMVHGSRVTLIVGLTSIVLGALIGVALGMLAGFLGGWTDRILMRIVDMQLSIPLTLLALMVVAMLGPSLQNLIVILALTSWVRYARIVRGQVLALREREFVMSARSAGASLTRILARHILPNVVTPILVVGTLELARVILLEASLSFLGMGVQPPSPSWGRMLAEGRTYIATAWWISTFPGLAIVLTVLSINFVGDWLRDRFDPRMSGERT